MIKNLEAIEILKERKWVDIEQYKALCELIKTALIDGEIEHTLRIGLENDNYKLMREKQDNEKKLKALEIILDCCDIELYRNRQGQCFIKIGNYLSAISKEKYELLKEVLL